MENKETYIEFISGEAYKLQIDIWAKTYNISREKIILFHDFLISLYDIVENTYLGPEFIHTDEQQKQHFTWCWNKTIESFNKEKIFFKENGSCYEYFWNFFLEAYYYNMLENRESKIKDYFNMLFEFSVRKSRSELDILTEIYKLFDSNLKK
jgi:hypothetical protein